MIAKLFSTAAVVTALSAVAAQAQVGRTPAEMPPASYSQTQYVDSNGCVFIRAGFNGHTTWVPRYGDDRRPMCGAAPSVAAGAAVVAQAAPTPAPAPAPVTVRAEPVVTAATAPRRATVAAAPVATVRTRAPYSVAPEGPPARTRVAQARPSAPTLHRVQAGGLDTRWSFYDRTGPSPCTNYNPHSQMYAVPSPARPDLPLRCGPQAQHPADALREQSPRGGVWEPWNGVNPYPGPNNNVYMLPPPYAPRWPEPYLHGASGHYAPAPAPAAPAVAAPRATVSTMGTMAGVTAHQPERSNFSGGRMSDGQYVQIGTFRGRNNMQAAIRALRAQGLPAATGRITNGGRPMQAVLAGPFSSHADLQAALHRARAMGYSDAFIR
ncbi:SPOR domain-containing protein [Pararhodobacter oceanensis]|uniref:SPOR domain-containing protein n=1 Tax=Pararhodobacter oceanensis TaxID=2172121 RepID=UPI003A8CC776